MFRMKLKRRKSQRTDYGKRLRLLFGRKDRVVIRKTLNNFSIQLVRYKDKSDQTLVEVSSKHLRQHGWKGHGGNISSAYLTGFLFGKIAAKKGFDSGVIDIGMQSKNSPVLMAAAIGVKDSGIEVPVGAEIPEERIKGRDIAAYAKKLKNDPEKYKKQFSAYIKNGLDPEKLPEHFEETKRKIEEM